MSQNKKKHVQLRRLKMLGTLIYLRLTNIGKSMQQEGLLPRSRERWLIAALALVQLVNILDFMMVMPLGPDFAEHLDIPLSKIGVVGGSYTLAAAVAGILASMNIDRFDRRPALCIALLGLSAGTVLGGFAVDLNSLVASRVVAGCFGGPASALSLAIIADVIPQSRRGSAMGIVMGSFSIASVFGVPFGLELAHRWHWHMPFFVLGGFGLFVGVLSWFVLPSLRFHLRGQQPKHNTRDLLQSPRILACFLTSGLTMFSMFLLIPNIAGFVQANLGFPRERMGELYMYGGTVSLFAMLLAGKACDRFGSKRTAAIGTTLFVVSVYEGFAEHADWFSVPLMFMTLMASSSLRNVGYQTFAAKIPLAHQRASFLSLQSTIQHLAISLGAFTSAQILSVGIDGKIIGMSIIAWMSIAFGMWQPLWMRFVESLPQSTKGSIKTSQ